MEDSNSILCINRVFPQPAKDDAGKKRVGTEAGNALLESAQGLPFGATLKRIMNAGFFDAGFETLFKKILRE